MNIHFKESHPSNFRVGRREDIKFIVIHYTANAGDTAWGNANYFHNNIIGTSAHYFVDEFDIYCSVIPQNTAWAVGGEPYPVTRPSHYKLCTNDNSISVEICSEKDEAGNYYFTEETLEHAVQFVRWLMNKYGIDIHHVIRHYDVTGKPCPAPMINHYAWEHFLSRIVDMSIDTVYDWEKVQRECGFADETMNYLLDYKYGPDLLRKLADAL